MITAADIAWMPSPDEYPLPCTRDPELFFAAEGRNGVRAPLIAHAKHLCREECTLRMQCLTMAMDQETSRDSRHGVYGGLDPDEREALARRVRA